MSARPCTLGAGCAEAGVCYASAMGKPDLCDARPAEPKGTDSAWYRGWECGFEPDRHNWCGDGWVGYKGGCDLDAPQTSGKTWDALLDEIDAEEDEQ